MTEVKSEAYFCPLMNFALDSKDVGGFADYNGVRYYLCCESCMEKFKKNPKAYVEKAATAVKPLAVAVVTASKK
ncbi:MAG TPA: YHS domain-containing protein [Fimbriimonadaceae bacterium]|nr:YHS domain-containing protein [Fimbriimonadaceae bacterium]